MLLVNKYQIPEWGMKIEEELPSSILEINEPKRIKEIAPVYCKLDVSLLNEDLIVRGQAKVTAHGQCDRCLEDIEMNIVADDICIVIEKCPEKVDLTNEIREDILLAFPQSYLCNEDCKGLCFQCGMNLNVGKCQCDEVKENDSPWDALENLKFKKDK